MQARTEPAWTNRWIACALPFALALLVAGCAGSGGKHSPPVEVRDASGFSITETTRVSAAARDDFEAAHRALEAGDPARAVEILRALTSEAPELTAAQINLGIALARQGELALAETALAKALEHNPNHPVARNELGIVYRRTGRFAEARKSFESALSTHPEFHPARKNLAILCDLYLADAACALEQYRLYRAVVPGDEKVGMWIADLENRIGG
ncbi:MAG: tetratricopeptide repeat protein [Deltaproteobacteria bacterium]|nr:tetratricopeptide repeat protein [Deltaproteobacteria bacterium]